MLQVTLRVLNGLAKRLMSRIYPHTQSKHGLELESLNYPMIMTNKTGVMVQH